MPSFQVDGVCYSSALLSVKAMAAREVGSIRQIGTAQYVVDSPSQTENSITYVFRNVSSTAVISTVETVVPQPCGLLDTADGLLIAWGIATAWLITYGVLFLKRGLQE